jgi:DNA mismatch repair protein MSH6
MSKLPPVMQQYWHFKSRHFDKVVCFKLGKFYEIFFEDAILAHAILDLNWMGDKAKLHVGFNEVSLKKYARKLVDKGIKVCIVE